MEKQNCSLQLTCFIFFTYTRSKFRKIINYHFIRRFFIKGTNLFGLTFSIDNPSKAVTAGIYFRPRFLLFQIMLFQLLVIPDLGARNFIQFSETSKIHAESEGVLLQPQEGPAKLVIGFGESLKIESLPDDIAWEILFDGVSIKQDIGRKLLDYKFERPGDYVVLFKEHNHNSHTECQHFALGSEIQIKVSPFKMTYLFDSIQFSAPVKRGSVSGIELSVPVEILTYDGNPIPFSQAIVKTMGVGTTIEAVPDNAFQQLMPGKNVLHYTLSGEVDRPTYIMFDFVDCNGNIQSFGLTQGIQ